MSSSNLRTNILGALVGMGPKSTSPFYERFLYEAKIQLKAKYDMDFPPLIMYSLPTPFIPNEAIDEALMKKQLRHGIETLVAAGAKIIAVPCNLVHVYFEDMHEAAGEIPLLNMVEIALSKLGSAHDSSRIGLIGTSPLMASKLYQNRIIKKGGRVFLDEKSQKKASALIGFIKQYDVACDVVKSAWHERPFLR